MTVMPGASRSVSPTNGPKAYAETDSILMGGPTPSPSPSQWRGEQAPRLPLSTAVGRGSGGGASSAVSSQRVQVGLAFEGAQAHQQHAAPIVLVQLGSQHV